MDTVSVFLPPVGEVVHVRGGDGICRAAIVTVAYSDESLRLRVLERTSAVEPVGSRDIEAVFYPEWAPTFATNPDGSQRALDSWHWRYHP